MQVLLKLSEKRPNLMLDQFQKIKAAALETPATITLAAQILSTAGKVNKVIVSAKSKCFHSQTPTPFWSHINYKTYTRPNQYCF